MRSPGRIAALTAACLAIAALVPAAQATAHPSHDPPGHAQLHHDGLISTGDPLRTDIVHTFRGVGHGKQHVKHQVGHKKGLPAKAHHSAKAHRDNGPARKTPRHRDRSTEHRHGKPVSATPSSPSHFDAVEPVQVVAVARPEQRTPRRTPVHTERPVAATPPPDAPSGGPGPSLPEALLLRPLQLSLGALPLLIAALLALAGGGLLVLTRRRTR